MKSYFMGCELSMGSHSAQASHSPRSLDIVKGSAAPQSNPIRTVRSGEAISEESSIPHDLEL